ncbi:MAG TPA: DUF3592 domain-containing protein, partial [Acidobacteriota bacterium]
MSPRTGGQVGCVGLFLLPFAAVGTFMFYLIFADLYGWFKMQTWEEVPARIISAKLETHSDSDGGTTYKTTAQYEYVYQDKRYTSTRVSRYGGADNIGSFQEDIYYQISPYQNSDKPFRCYVNPTAPQESILYRKARMGMVMFYSLFAFCFGGVGYGIFGGMLLSTVYSLRSSSLMKLHPNQPWMHRSDWSRGEVRNPAGLKMIISVAMSIFIGLLCIPILIYLPGEIRDHNYYALFGLLFPLVALFLIKWAAECVIAWKRFGSAVLQLQTIPIKSGERLRGFLKTGSKLKDSETINLELKCEKRVKMSSGGRSSFNTDTFWSSNSQTVGMMGADGNTSFQIDIPIPEDLPSTSASEDD